MHRISNWKTVFRFSQTVYMRKLPPQLISFSSEAGKRLFKEALLDGTMECYFPLAEQFLTQHKPSTCGATSLVMVLNALKVDPLIKWEGIWRWYNEENLIGLKAQHLSEGISLADLSHIARHNSVAIQTFYHPDQLSLPTGQPSKPQFYDCLDECVKADHGLLVLDFESFKLCIEASTRRSGFFIIINNSRQALGQTGIGHFCPVGGYHSGNQSALLMDVARFKYPPQWCELGLLFDSMRMIDAKSNMTRGMCLITRSIQYPHLCRVSEDLIGSSSLKGWHTMSPSWKLNLPKEVVLQSVVYLFDFLERQAYHEFHEPFDALQQHSPMKLDELQECISKQKELKSLLNDFSFRDGSLMMYLALLIYNYLFNSKIGQLPPFLKKEFIQMEQSFGLNLI